MKRSLRDHGLTAWRISGAVGLLCAFVNAACSSSNAPATTSAARTPLAYPGDPAGTADPKNRASYPSSWGLVLGSTFPNFEFQGYLGGSSTWTTIHMRDYYDPDGSRGMKAIYFIVSAQWCEACKAEAPILPDLFTRYSAQGVRFVTAMIQTASFGPATQVTVDQWIAAYGINFDIVLDPQVVNDLNTPLCLPPMSTKMPTYLPWFYVINPRNMQITRRLFGAGTDANANLYAVDKLIVANGGTPPPPVDAGLGD